MAELDYKLALSLHRQYHEELKSKLRLQRSDESIARLLQEQFEYEAGMKTPPIKSVHDNYQVKLDNSINLADPSLELVDPTPDIHALFVAFDRRFFGSSLQSVSVSWSKRMTTCAGICTYRGKRSGMCTITLSEPLLKLRPRKDLVETLLHEMIHAFLFVTHNNRDRDGHGPEFHKHMYRINRECGTNISVYHNFHNEVQLYKQHWWRCNGPCQHRGPYFGLVRRAMNRAPGPNDRWWADHLRDCCGTFIKIKEPEKKATAQKKKGISSKPSNFKGDIRNYFKVTAPIAGNNEVLSNNKNRVGSSKTKDTLAGTKNYTSDFEAVRNHWQNKFSSNSTNTKRSPVDADTQQRSPKIPKLSPTNLPSNAFNFIQCPICSQELLMTDLNDHLDTCLVKVSSPSGSTVDVAQSPNNICDLDICLKCGLEVASVELNTHLENCAATPNNNSNTKCLVCGKQILKSDLNSHLDECMNNIFDCKHVDVEDKTDFKAEQFNCPYCLKIIDENKMKTHIDACLNAGDNDIVDLLTADDF